MFETFSIKFHNREAFNTAVSVLINKHWDAFFVDVGHADMIISFDSNSALRDFVAELPVSSEYFTINQ
jgi:hypothetical protein